MFFEISEIGVILRLLLFGTSKMLPLLPHESFRVVVLLTISYIYQYRDHLGNVRVSFARNSTGAPEILDVNNYYPFGLSHIGQEKGLLGGYLNYKFGGMELQETGMFDFGARFYMPDLGRWGVIDPLAEQMRRYSPYNYGYNNPVKFTDPDGRKPMAPDQEQAQWMHPMSLLPHDCIVWQINKKTPRWCEQDASTIINNKPLLFCMGLLNFEI